MANFIKSDLEFILQQIFIAEAHAAGASLDELLPNSQVPWGLRTVDGSYNNLVEGRTFFGAADQEFLLLLDQQFRNDLDGDTFDMNGPADGGLVDNTDYAAPSHVADADPRLISNLIVDQTISNPAAVQVYVQAGLGTLADGINQLDPNGIPYAEGTLLDLAGVAIPAGQPLFIPNTAPDEGLSAGFNTWFTFFGQFFDHGLDLVNKGGNGFIFIPLQEDDPLYNAATPQTNFMVVTRASVDENGQQTNQTTPFVDQNQTYSSHASHQVFLREYAFSVDSNNDGILDSHPMATGRLLTNTALDPEGQPIGGMATWAMLKAQARDVLGIELDDYDVGRVPLLATDQYGNFIPGANGLPQLVIAGGLLEGDLAAPVDASLALTTGHGFLDDIAHSANPFNSQTGAPLVPGSYDGELLDAHFIAGDGRVNENIALTAVHHVFHAEHNRLVEHTKDVAVASNDASFVNQWLLAGAANQITQQQLDAINAITDPDDKAAAIDALNWNGERLFQAAKFGTEMQYQHLVFEEFARKVQPLVDEFLIPNGYDATINPAIMAEFAHTVYRFGHSMLTETVDRLDPTFQNDSSLGLIEAFLNPLAFNQNGTLSPEEAAGAIVRGLTRQLGNEIDEFVTSALRNSLLGLPLDLAAINIARGRDTGVPSLNQARAEFFAMTGDSQLRPYTSWLDFALHLKHPESLINFIAAYGTHVSITGVTSLAAKRAAAMDIVFGNGTNDAERMAFLNGPAATTGVNDIDFWIGGLAEQIMPFGGMLGSSFNFVFETQMEALQNGDRFYYLARLDGLNFLTEMEDNSFAKLVMRHTDAVHLPADIFSTPGLILEVIQGAQFNEGLGSADPLGDNPLVPLVIRDNLETVLVETNYLRYTGDEHVVLGGTAGDDIMISSLGDDTLWGDGGNDRLEGGDGNDVIEGGAGDDIITDKGGDDVLKGGDGNDVIHGGNGFNLILGGHGNDFIITGEDVSEVFAGTGNDFILGAKGNLQTAGNEGDDWIEIGTQDGAPGDNLAPFADDLVAGHDVFIGGPGFDEVIGEGGDDIMVGSEGADHFDGNSGFDWAVYKDDPFGVKVDLIVDDFVEPPVAPSNAGILDRFAEVEGLSGSAEGDILRGDNADAALIAQAGAQGSVLTAEGIARIANLQQMLTEFFGEPQSSFGSGNIILGGGGSDVLEGRGGDDLLDGDRWLNVRISVLGRDENGQLTDQEIDSFNSMKDMMHLMLDGTYDPGQLVIVREILDTAPPGTSSFDTAVFSGRRADYQVATNGDVTTVSHLIDDGDGNLNPGIDGVDRVMNVERLQFADGAMVLVNGVFVDEEGTTSADTGNNAPTGLLQILNEDGSPVDVPAVGQLLRVSAAGVGDADNDGGLITGRPVSYIWQYEAVAGSGIFQDIIEEGGARPSTQDGVSYRVTPNLDGLAIRVIAIYQDDNGVMERAASAATDPVAGGELPLPPAPLPVESEVESPGNGLRMIRSDLQFILDQIMIAERHAAGEDLMDIIPNSRLPWGLRTVDGSYNNLVPGQWHFGAADQVFPRLLDPQYRNDLDEDPIDINGPTEGGGVTNTDYSAPGHVIDSDPRVISNLVVDQTISNPAAVQAYVDAGLGTLDENDVLLDLSGVPIPAGMPLFIPNSAPDEGLSAGFNSWFTLFGQFFDHGLDLVNKGGNGMVFVPLKDDDPLVLGPDGEAGTPDDLAPNLRFMVLTRATVDENGEQTNQTTPFVDQNQTYTSHASHQVFLREYVMTDDGPVATGRLLNGADGGLPTWAEVKAQARNLLGIELTDGDALNIPLIKTDQYGKFIPGAGGMPQLVVGLGPDGIPFTDDDVVVLGNLATPVNTFEEGALRIGHAFLDDIAHSANPFNSQSPGVLKQADADGVVNTPDNPPAAGFYDNELLDRHFITGDGRGNENIGLTAVHHVFHAEHNRVVAHTKDVVLASNDASFVNQWLLAGAANQITQQQLDTINALTDPAAKATAINALDWNGERLFQAARFATEMQYQHLVFEEFARKVQPQVDVFFNATQVYDSTLNPAIMAEFAHVVYRFGHSMLTETVDRLNPDFVSSELGLIEAFLNPLMFNQLNNPNFDPLQPVGPGNEQYITVSAEEAAGAIARGMTRQLGNEIDEFVTEALRNNLLGLPLDLATINLTRARETGVPSLNAARQEFYNMTGDSQLKPYTSWVDFSMNLKHQSSLVNFIAAYGTHATILAADTLVDKRAAAMNLVFGDASLTDPLAIAAFNAERMAFLYGPAATTGVNSIDFWIGGLAEKIMPFGGMLGSTFNFVFESQMEALQDADRFYYLERLAGLNMLTEMENNFFSRMVMANTDATHLPGDIFSTPGFILEVDQTRQHTGLGLDGRADPDSGDPLLPEVVRGANFLRYNGDEHVVLGGTEGNDTLIGSIGDDTLWGDGGNDRIEGGFGNDFIMGGAGDDIITDMGGDDVIRAGEGNDVVHAGNGFNLVMAGHGKDFVISGEDGTEVFGGPGDDFILGTRGNEAQFGNEGNDWLELGGPDGNGGDNFNEFGLDDVIGHDVFIGEFGIIDRMDGEGGDDIMAGNGGEGDRYVGGSGFDWAMFRDDPFGVNVDFRLRAFNETPVAPSDVSVLARFESMQGLSGSQHGDILNGDDDDATAIALSGAYGSVLSDDYMDMVDGLRAFINEMILRLDDNGDPIPVTSFGAGNIILGGNGSDLIAGNGGDDLIDGDMWLNVRISVRALDEATGLPTDVQIDSFDSMVPMIPLMLNGTYKPGQLVIVRELMSGTVDPDNLGQSFDTAVYSGLSSEYEFVERFDLGEGVFDVRHVGVDGVDADGDGFLDVVGADGLDTIRNIERIQFNDGVEVLVAGLNAEVQGQLRISDGSPSVGQLLRVQADLLRDGDNANGNVTGPISYYWQVDLQGNGVFTDIVSEDFGAGSIRATGPSFQVGAEHAGLSLRVKAVYKDGHGVLETAFSAPTTPVVTGGNLNDLPVGSVLISNMAPSLGDELTATNAFTDADGLAGAAFSYQWQAGTGSNFANIAGATGPSFTPTVAQAGQQIRVVVSYTDNGNTLESLTSMATAVLAGIMVMTTFGGTLVGTAGSEIMLGSDGDDILRGMGGDDTLEGGVGNDILIGGTGNDIMRGGAGSDTYEVTEVSDQVIELGGEGYDTVWTSLASYSLTANVERLMYGSSIGDFTGTGNALDNWIQGGVGNDRLAGGAGIDTLVGGAGNDILIGGTGNDIMRGGAGSDTYEVTEAGDQVIELGGEGYDTVWTSLASYSLTANVERLMYGGSGNFTGTGNALGNWIEGRAGNDLLNGGAGIDTLVGGAGNDILIGGTGNDIMRGGAGSDTYEVTEAGDQVIELGGEGYDTVWTSLASYSLTANVERLMYGSSIGGFTGTGNALDNWIQGGVGNDRLTGGAGIDTLVGGAGNDILIGGTGNDIMRGGAGSDTYEVTEAGDQVIESGGEGYDTVWTSLASYSLTANVERLMYGGSGNFTGTGNGLDNWIQGRAGNDVLTGGAGNDTLVGGLGNDIFVFGTSFGNDRILDFDANPVDGQDLLNIAAFNLTAATFASRVAIADAGADTVITVNGADGGSIRLVGVTDHTSVTQADFQLV